jgi:BirA family biotin operon repressor/biotin-[acetyl-CoA-carboxylase] ligase
MHTTRHTAFEKSFLAVLSDGVPLLARPVGDDDMRALFGGDLPCRPDRPDPAPPSFRKKGYAGCMLLWSGSDGLDVAARAARIVASCGSGSGFPCGLDMPAACFLAGACSSAFPLAWRLARDGLLPVWGSVLASCQETGYGQFRRRWHSPRGNLHVCFRLPADALFGDASAAVVLGLLACGVLRKRGFPLSLKWPNDLLVEQRAKVGGILVEERDGIIIAGLGVNTAEAPGTDLLRGDGSLPAAVLPCPAAVGRAGGGVAPLPLWRILVSDLIVACRPEAGKRTPAELVGESSCLLAWTGRRALMDDGGPAPVTGRILGCGGDGSLLLRLDDGSGRKFFNGSVTLQEKARYGDQDL